MELFGAEDTNLEGELKSASRGLYAEDIGEACVAYGKCKGEALGGKAAKHGHSAAFFLF